MTYKHNTNDYHAAAPDLMTELTVCESLSTIQSPHAIALGITRSYGALIGTFLKKHGLLSPGATLMEAGGGYGSLMAGLLSSHGTDISKVVMTDVSDYMLGRQQKALKNLHDNASFVKGDIQLCIPPLHSQSLVLLNEMIGDLDMLVDVDPNCLPDEAAPLINLYSLEIPAVESFNLNIGAIKLVERICVKGHAAFISEHSSDPVIPEDMQYLGDGLSHGFPREIKLGGHSEYNIRFSHLIKTAEANGRRTKTGALIDLISIEKTPSLEFIFRNRITYSEKHELIYEFLDHIREYRWLLVY